LGKKVHVNDQVTTHIIKNIICFCLVWNFWLHAFFHETSRVNNNWIIGTKQLSSHGLICFSYSSICGILPFLLVFLDLFLCSCFGSYLCTWGIYTFFLTRSHRIDAHGLGILLLLQLAQWPSQIWRHYLYCRYLYCCLCYVAYNMKSKEA
jgi:hypothetical protein